jgi:hypothetical protein
MGWVFIATPRLLYGRKRPGTHCIGGWVGHRTGLDECGKSRPPSGFDPQTVQPVASLYTDWAIPAHLQDNVTYVSWHLPHSCPNAVSTAVLWQCISVYLSVSQCISVYLSVSQCISVYLGVSQCISVYLSVSQCISVYLGVSRCISVYLSVSQCMSMCLSVSQCISVYLGVSQCVSVRLSVSQCISVYLSVSQCISVYLSVSQCISVYLSVYIKRYVCRATTCTGWEPQQLGRCNDQSNRHEDVDSLPPSDRNKS